MDARDMQRTEVSENYQAFVADLPNLVTRHRGKYALYRHGRLVGCFEAFSLAWSHGLQSYDDREFSVQEITDEPLTLGCLFDAAGEDEL